MRRYLKPLLAVLWYAVIQGVTSVLVSVLAMLGTMCKNAWQTGGHFFSAGSCPDGMPPLGFGEMAAIIFVSGAVTLYVLARLTGSLRFPRALDPRGVCWRQAPLVLLAFAAGVLAVNLFFERFDLPDWAGDSLAGLMGTLPGVLAVGVVGPLVEEAVFREALLGGMLHERVSPGRAILISSFVFGAIHVNPAQMPAAFVIGMMLGVVYWRTGNIVLPCLLHMANNLLCVGLTRALGDPARTFTWGKWMGGDPVAIVVMAVSALLCVWLFMVFVRCYPVAETPGDNEE